MSPAREAVNEAIEKLSKEVSGRVLFVGVDKVWDYRHLFKEYETMDINKKLNPDILGDIQSCDSIPNETYDAVIMTGVYEFLSQPHEAIKTIHRILKPKGIALICPPGGAYYADKPTASWYHLDWEVQPLRIEEVKVVYYKSNVPYYFIIRATKWI